MKSLAEETKQVVALAPVTTNLALEGDIVSLKNTGVGFIEVMLTQAVGHATAITVEQAQDVAGTGAKAITNAVPIWANEDVAASDTLVRQTNAVSHTVAADVKNKIVVFQIDPAQLDINNGFDCLQVKIAASSQATNLVCAKYTLAGYRYKGEDIPSAIVD